MKYLSVTVLLLSLACFAGCKNGNGTKTFIIDRRDSGAYRMGYDHGKLLIEKKDNIDSIKDLLLDIRARENNIRSRIRESAGDAYIQGFRRYIEEHDDSLAGELF